MRPLSRDLPQSFYGQPSFAGRAILAKRSVSLRPVIFAGASPLRFLACALNGGWRVGSSLSWKPVTSATPLIFHRLRRR